MTQIVPYQLLSILKKGLKKSVSTLLQSEITQNKHTSFFPTRLVKSKRSTQFLGISTLIFLFVIRSND